MDGRWDEVPQDVQRLPLDSPATWMAALVSELGKSGDAARRAASGRDEGDLNAEDADSGDGRSLRTHFALHMAEAAFFAIVAALASALGRDRSVDPSRVLETLYGAVLGTASELGTDLWSGAADLEDWHLRVVECIGPVAEILRKHPAALAGDPSAITELQVDKTRFPGDDSATAPSGQGVVDLAFLRLAAWAVAAAAYATPNGFPDN